MELEEKKNFKALTALVGDFQKEGDTIFAIFGIGDECGRVLGGAVASRVAEARV